MGENLNQRAQQMFDTLMKNTRRLFTAEKNARNIHGAARSGYCFLTNESYLHPGGFQKVSAADDTVSLFSRREKIKQFVLGIHKQSAAGCQNTPQPLTG